MKKLKPFVAGVLLAAFCAAPFVGLADDAKPKLKPYPLKTCIISGDKLGEMGDPYVYEYKGREIKFCCKSCVKDFKKDPEKYLKKIDEQAAKEKKAAAK
jgi:YHS domain-containing protein